VKTRRFRAATGLSVALLLGLELVLASSSAAFADDATITLTPATQSAEYGQGWALVGTVSGDLGGSYDVSLIVTSGSTTATFDSTDTDNQIYISDGSAPALQALGVGTHSISVKFAAPLPFIGVPQSTTPATVTITPAAISTTTTIAPDPNNSSNAIITSQLSGKYIDQLPNCQCDGENGYLLPAGTWNLNVTDSQGKTVLTKSYDQPANGLPAFVNYWSNVPTGETFTAQSTFTVAGSAKSNFTLTSQKFSYTSKKSAGEKGPGSPSAKPKPITVKNASFAPPVIVYWAALLVALIIVALDVILLVSNRRARASHAAETSTVQS
jgi:hypothetical protein